MVSVKCNSWAMVSMWEKCMVQFMYHVNSWRDVKKSLTHYNVYKVKGYFNFHISNLELSKNKIGSKLYL
jgi:hypothetical protein